MSWLDGIDINDLEEPYHTLAVELGLETAKKIAEIFQGSQVYFPRLEKVCDPKRKELIREEFNGYNFKELADKYGYTDRWIRMLVSDKISKERNKPIENQINLFEINNIA